MGEFATKTPMVPMAAANFAVTEATRKSRPRSRNAAIANFTGVAMSSAKLV